MSYRHNARSVNAKTVLLSCQTVLSVSPNGLSCAVIRALLWGGTASPVMRMMLFCVVEVLFA